MSARQIHPVDASAFHLAALLEQYEQDVDELTCSPFDATAYARVSRAIGEMRLLCAGLPLLSVPWLQLLISHTELVHSLWATPAASEQPQPDARCNGRHLAAVRALRVKCLGQFTRTERGH